MHTAIARSYGRYGDSWYFQKNNPTKRSAKFKSIFFLSSHAKINPDLNVNPIGLQYFEIWIDFYKVT
jgi:hypothetical protein